MWTIVWAIVRIPVVVVGALFALVPLSTLGMVFSAPVLRLKRMRVTHWCLRMWGKSWCFLFGTKVTVQTTDGFSLDPSKSYLFMANHSSHLDDTVLLSILPARSIWVLDMSIFRYWFLGWVIWCAGFVGVKRDGNDAEAIRRLATIGKEILRPRECSLLIFPEGGRSRNGVLRRFKKGAARAAIQNKLPVVIVTILGTFDLMNPNGFEFPRAGDVSVKFGGPIDPPGSLDELDEFNEEMYQRMKHQQVVQRKEERPLRAVAS